MRQVQAHEAPRRHLRQVRRGSHAGARPPRAPGPRRAGQPLLARVVLQGPAQPHRPPAGHHSARTRAGALLRSLRGGGPRRGRGHLQGRGDHRREEARAGPRVSGQVRRHDGRRGHQGAAQEGRRRCLERRNSREDEDRGVGPEKTEIRQAAAGGGIVPQIRQQAGVDDPRRDSRHPARVAPAGSPRWRTLRHLRPQRSLPPRHQPQQPVEEAHRAARARRDRAQRKAHVAGSRGRAVRQRPPRPRPARRQQPAAQIALRHPQGQAGTLPPEPARQARGLLRPFRHRGRPRAAPQPVRSSQEDGARAVQALHLPPAGAARPLHHHQAGQGTGGAAGPRGVGHSRRGHQGPPHSAEPRSHAAPPGHPGLRAGAGGRQGHQDSPAGVHGVQRRFRRRPDGGAHSAVAGSADRSFHADALLQQHSFAGARQPHRRPHAGHGAGLLLPDQGASGRQGRGPHLRFHRRRADRPGDGRGGDAHPHQAALHRPRNRPGARLRQPEHPAHRAHRVHQAVHGNHGRPRHPQRQPAAGHAVHQRPAEEEGPGRSSCSTAI